MTRIRTHRIKAVVIAAIVLALGVTAGASALVHINFVDSEDNFQATFEGGVSPTSLPKHGSAPVGLTLNGKMSSIDGSHLKALDTINLHFDKAGSINVKGLGTCTVGKLLSTTTKDAEKKCKKAIVGEGNVTADVALPEQKPFGASGPLIVFNGPSSGSKKELILHVYAKVPAATTFVVPVKVTKDHGKFGTKAFIDVPTIVSGKGSLTGFKAKIKKTWSVKGKKQSLLNAGCPKGKLSVEGEFKITGGGMLKGGISVPCKPKG